MRDRIEARRHRWRRRRRLKIALRLGLVFLLIGGMAYLMWYLVAAFPPLARLALNRLQDQLAAELGTPVRVRTVEISLPDRITLYDLLVADPTTKSGLLFYSPEVRVQLNPWDFWRGGIRLGEVRLPRGGMIALYRTEAGYWNLDDLGGRGDGVEGPALEMTIRDLEVKDLKLWAVGLMDEPLENRIDLEGSLSLSGGGFQVRVDGGRLKTSFWDLHPFDLEGTFRVEDDVLAIRDAEIREGETRLPVHGEIDFRARTVDIVLEQGRFDLVHLPPFVPVREELGGVTEVEGYFGGPFDWLALDVELEARRAEVFGQSLSEFRSDLLIRGDTLRFSEARFQAPGGKVRGEALLAFGQSPAGYRLNAQFEELDLSQSPLSLPLTMVSRIPGRVTLEGEGFGEDGTHFRGTLEGGPGQVAGVDFRSLRVEFEGNEAGLERGKGGWEVLGSVLSLSGSMGREGIDLEVHGEDFPFHSVMALVGIGEASGKLSVTGRVTGSLDAVAFQGRTVLREGHFKELQFGEVGTELDFRLLPDGIQGEGGVLIQDGSYGVLPLAGVMGRFAVAGRTLTLAPLTVNLGNQMRVETEATVQFEGDRIEGTLSPFRFTYQNHIGQAGEPIRFSAGPAGLQVEPATLLFEPGEVHVGGRWGSLESGGEVDLAVRIRELYLERIADVIPGEDELTGRVEGVLHVVGTREAPEVGLSLTVEQPLYRMATRVRSLTADRLTLSADYRGRRLQVERFELAKGQAAMSGSAIIPVDLALMEIPRRVLDLPLNGQVAIRGIPLSDFLVFLTMLRITAGRVEADIELGGTTAQPHYKGTGRIRGGQGLVLPFNTRLDGVEGEFQVEDGILTLDRFVSRSADGTLEMTGSIVFDGLLPDRYDLRARVNRAAVREFGYASFLGLSGDFRVTGPVSYPLIAGNVHISQGLLNIPFRDSDYAAGQEPEPWPFDLDLALTATNNVWLRNRTSEIELSVDARIKKEGEDVVLLGGLQTIRGAYSRFGKRFTITQGEIRFTNSVPIDPLIAIEARYAIRSGGGGDGRVGREVIRLVITGSYREPEFQALVEGHPEVSEQTALTLMIWDMTLEEYQVASAARRDRLANQAARLVAREADTLLQGLTGLDVFEFEPQLFGAGRDDRSARFTLGKYLSRDFFISYTQDVLNPEAIFLSAEFFLGRRSSLIGQTDASGNFSLDFKLRFKY